MGQSVVSKVLSGSGGRGSSSPLHIKTKRLPERLAVAGRFGCGLLGSPCYAQEAFRALNETMVNSLAETMRRGSIELIRHRLSEWRLLIVGILRRAIARLLLTVGASTAITLLSASPASAALFLVSYSGPIISGTDRAGIFGPSEQSLVGGTMRVDYYHYLNSVLDPYKYGPGTYYYNEGQGIVTLVEMYINGVKKSFQPSFSGTYYTTIANRGSNLVYYSSYASLPYGDNGYEQIEANSMIGSDEIQFSSGVPGTEFEFNNPNLDARGSFFINYNGGPGQAFGEYRPNSISVRMLEPFGFGSVPEPSTWVMMILGIGIVGWTVRRKGQFGQRSTTR